jgi:hypothetical protein
LHEKPWCSSGATATSSVRLPHLPAAGAAKARYSCPQSIIKGMMGGERAGNSLQKCTGLLALVAEVCWLFDTKDTGWFFFYTPALVGVCAGLSEYLFILHRKKNAERVHLKQKDESFTERWEWPLVWRFFCNQWHIYMYLLFNSRFWGHAVTCKAHLSLDMEWKHHVWHVIIILSSLAFKAEKLQNNSKAES